MKKNIVKQALLEGKVQLGTGFGQFRSPEIPRMLAAAGFHWAFIDTEHGGFDLETVQDICRVSNLCGLSPIVRVGDLQYSLVARALDCGAQGIIFPRVESPELLAKAVSWTKFPPAGIRGYGLGAWQVDYEPLKFPEIIAHANANNMVVLQIETQRALDARDELLAVKGVDTVLIGPADLSISLGVPGSFSIPKWWKPLKPCGIVARSTASCREYRRATRRSPGSGRIAACCSWGAAATPPCSMSAPRN